MSSLGRLQRIVEDVLSRSAARRLQRPASSLRSELPRDAERGARFVRALRAPGLSIIAECKRCSPSAGQLSQEVDLAARVRDYAAGGASALSILTESDHFGGSLEDLRVAPEVQIPRLRKDFLLDEYAVLESAHAGADAVLLIARCLDGGALQELRDLARECGLAVLIEAHDEPELVRAIEAQPEAVGVNARNLDSFEVDLAVVEALLPQIPSQLLRVAESGMSELGDLQRVLAAGADVALIGSALMRSPEPRATLRSWKEGLHAS